MTREEAKKIFEYFEERAKTQEPCDDVVSRQAVIYYIKGHIHEIITESGTDKNAHTNSILRALINGVETMPPVNPQPCDDAISRKAVNTLVDELARAISDERCHIPQRGRDTGHIMHDILELPSVTQKSGKWIALVARPMTNEEREYYSEQLDYCDGDAVIYNCPLPEEGQDVLITTCTGAVLIDTFFNDYDGCGFEGYDIEDVKAWMPLPKPYEPQESEDNDADSD